MTSAAKLTAIIALLKDEQGAWREDVNGADFVQNVSLIIDTPTTGRSEIADLYDVADDDEAAQLDALREKAGHVWTCEGPHNGDTFARWTIEGDGPCDQCGRVKGTGQ